MSELAVGVFSTFELLYPNMKVRLQIISARPGSYMISDNPNGSLGIADCSFYTRRIALKVDYQIRKTDMPACTLVKFDLLAILPNTFIFSHRKSQLIRENLLNNVPVRRTAKTMNTNSAFTGSFPENPFCYQ